MRRILTMLVIAALLALTGAAAEAGLPDEAAVSRWLTETRRKERAK